MLTPSPKSREEQKKMQKQKVFTHNWRVFVPKSSEDQKKVFTAFWDHIRPEFVGFICADRPFFVWLSRAQISMGEC